MSFDPRAFLVSCIGNDEDSLFAVVADDSENLFSIRFGRKLAGVRADDGTCDLMSAWHSDARLLTFRILLGYEEFGLREVEEGVLLVDSMNSTIDQLTRFSTFHDTSEKGKSTHWICAQVELLVLEELEGREDWPMHRLHLSHLLTRLVGEAEWHVHYSGKPRMRIAQTN